MDVRGGPPPPLPPELDAFKRLITSYGNRKAGTSIQIFVKKADIQFVELPVNDPVVLH